MSSEPSLSSLAMAMEHSSFEIPTPRADSREKLSRATSTTMESSTWPKAELGTNLITLLKGRGDGTSRTQARYAVAVGPIALAIGDFNGAQALDAAVVNVGSNTFSICLSPPP